MGLLELPHNIQEFLSSQVVSGLASFLEEFLFCDCLGGNACVISPWDIEGLVSAHAFVADQCVFDGYGEGVSDMEVPCDVGRREADGEFLGVGGLVVGVEEFAEWGGLYFYSHQAFQWRSTAVGL